MHGAVRSDDKLTSDKVTRMKPFPWWYWQLHGQIVITSCISTAAAVIAITLMVFGLVNSSQLPAWWFLLGHTAAGVSIIATIRSIRATTRLHVQTIRALGDQVSR